MLMDCRPFPTDRGGFASNELILFKVLQRALYKHPLTLQYITLSVSDFLCFLSGAQLQLTLMIISDGQ